MALNACPHDHVEKAVAVSAQTQSQKRLCTINTHGDGEQYGTSLCRADGSLTNCHAGTMERPLNNAQLVAGQMQLPSTEISVGNSEDFAEVPNCKQQQQQYHGSNVRVMNSSSGFHTFSHQSIVKAESENGEKSAQSGQTMQSQKRSSILEAISDGEKQSQALRVSAAQSVISKVEPGENLKKYSTATHPSQRENENIQQAPEYATEIFALLLKEESKHLPRANYMEIQKDINAKMRAILMDWLVEVHMKYRLRHETLYLTVSTIDRYLTKQPVLRKRLQLVGVVAMFIAAKFEEVMPPGVKDYEYITDNAYTTEDILLLECQMLTKLDFQVVVPTAAHFMDHLQRINGCDNAHREFIHYLSELALLEIRMIRFTPSHLVSAAILLSNEIRGLKPAWPAVMQEHAQHSEDQLRPCVEELRNLLEGAPLHWLQAVRKKYQSAHHFRVANGWPRHT